MFALVACSTRSASKTGDSAATDVPGVSLLSRMAGLWSGPATQTPLGDFAQMNMDFRSPDNHSLFARCDLDSLDALRLMLSIETFDGQDQVVFRNGGYFQGMQRDDRTNLVAVAETESTYELCSESSGCGYIDARFSFPTSDQLLLNVKVKGNQHLTWTARRKETRDVGTPFPIDEGSQGLGTAPMPSLSQLRATVTWTSPLAAAGTVWVILSTTPCQSIDCTVSRSLSVSAPAGATSAAFSFDQLFDGSYYGLAIVDPDNTLNQTLVPSTGDSISIPNQVVMVPKSGQGTAAFTIAYTL